MSSQPEKKPLVVWIFQTGEPLHVDQVDARPMRAMNLANALVAAGHKVVLWSSAFYHQKKTHRTKKYEVLTVHKNLEIRLIPSKGYDRNIGVGRLIDHVDLGLNLRNVLKYETSLPDVGFVGFPPIEFAYIATKYLTRKNVPCVLDVKDQWPQIFVEAFPAPLQDFVKLAFFPYFHLARKTISMANSLTSMTHSFVKWGQDFGQRKNTKNDSVFPLSPEESTLSSNDLNEATNWWLEKDAEFIAAKRFNVIFIGSISRAFDFVPIAKAAKLAKSNRLPWKFIICGAGEKFEETKDLFSDVSNVIFPGWINRAQITTLANASAIGLAPYKNTKSFIDSVPNKVIDYLALGLPIVSPLSGEVQALIANHSVGRRYDESNSSDLFNQLYELYTNTTLQARLKENCVDTYREHFAGDVVYSRLVSHLELLAAGVSTK